MSYGSSWKSPSITTTHRPRVALNPALMAPVRPAWALRRSNLNTMVRLVESSDDRATPVTTAVIHEDDFEAEANEFQRVQEFRPQDREALFLIVDGETIERSSITVIRSCTHAQLY